MKVVLLAAGAAKRLRPLTDDRPKCLLDVGGMTILGRTMGHMAAAGIEELAVVTGFCAPRIHEAVAGWPLPFPVRFIHNEVWETTNNSYSLLLARPFVDGEAFVMLDADIVFELGVLKAVLDAPVADCLALRPADDLGPEEIKCELNGRGLIRLIGKQIPPAQAAGESIGIERFSAVTSTRLFRTLEERAIGRGLKNEWYEASFQELIDRGELDLHPVSTGRLACAEIDTPEDLAAAQTLFASRAA